MLARAMGANKLIGVEKEENRIKIAKDKGLVDEVYTPGEDTLEKIRQSTGGHGVEKAFDCSGNNEGRQLAIRATRKWGKVALVGEGGDVTFQPSADIIHEQISIHGSWVTSIWMMEELVERLSRWNLHPEELVTNRYTLDKAGEAYELMAGGKSGKVAVVFDEEDNA
jgi:threonine dehydrogenase-like Zn-dependent dehydrogenase